MFLDPETGLHSPNASSVVLVLVLVGVGVGLLSDLRSAIFNFITHRRKS